MNIDKDEKMEKIKQLSAQGNSAERIIELAQSDPDLHNELKYLIGFASTGKIDRGGLDGDIAPTRARNRLSAQASYAMRLPLSRKTNTQPISDL